MSAAEKPTGYAELISVLEVLPVLVREKRRREGLSLRAAAKATGEVASTLSRFENGVDVQMTTALSLLRWVSS